MKLLLIVLACSLVACSFDVEVHGIPDSIALVPTIPVAAPASPTPCEPTEAPIVDEDAGAPVDVDASVDADASDAGLVLYDRPRNPWGDP